VSETIIWEMKTDDARRDALEQYLRGTLDDTRAHDGCESVVVHRNSDDPNHIIMVERWATHEQYQAYVAWRATLGGRIKDFQAEPSFYRRFEILEDI
jgi:quinol monooxygenase YgiN